MTYKINGTTLSLQPTAGRWNTREELGVDGAGHPRYPLVREFEIQWGLMPVADFNQIYNFFNACGVTGTAIVDLPKFANATWAFQSYTGCVLREPQTGNFFEETVTDVVLLVTNIRV